MYILQFGDVAVWVGSIGTCVGALGTIGAFAIAIVIYNRDLQDRKKTQARLITAWQYKLQPHGAPTVTYRVKNNNNEPANNVILVMPCGVRGTFVRDLGTLGPKEIRQVTIFLPGSPRSEEYSPTLIFRDASGTIWLRNGYGKLKEISTAEITVVAKEDPGAYSSIAEHPTLNRTPAGESMAGIKIKDS